MAEMNNWEGMESHKDTHGREWDLTRAEMNSWWGMGSQKDMYRGEWDLTKSGINSGERNGCNN